MAKSSCISANTILGIVIACINILPQIMLIFDIIAIFLAFALDLNYAKVNRFNIKEVISFVVLPLIIPTVTFEVIYTIYLIFK